MERISTTKFNNGPGPIYNRVTRGNPVILTRYGQDAFVLIDAEQFAELIRQSNSADSAVTGDAHD